MAATAADSATPTISAADTTTHLADLKHDAVEEPSSSSKSEEKIASEIEIGNLTINESNNKFFHDPESSNIKTITSGETPYASAFTFEELNLLPELLKGLYVEMKYEKPSKIQAISLPMILNPPYLDLIAQAHNGSGKTACFTLGMLSRIDPKLKAPQAICICPTRELAIQNLEVLRKMGKYSGITSECEIHTGKKQTIRPPITSQIVIGTPGTIGHRIRANKLSLSYLKILVLDEADHMLAEDGFKADSVHIMDKIRCVNPQCQVLFFSATFNVTVKEFAAKIVKGNHNQLFVKKEELSLQSVKQYKVNCPDELAKVMVIKDRILEFGERVGQTIIFVRTRNSAMTLHRTLVEIGYDVTTIQGALKQEDRDKIVKEFKDGLTQVLISTDLLARGFDQDQVNLVINYDLPVKHNHPTEPDCEVYMHRIGRAGRFGRKGAVFNLLCGDADEMIMTKIKTHFGTEIEEVPDWRNEEDFVVALRSAGLL
ncbi:DEAD-box ATP-dependent RNA helicase 38-like protein [Gossypium australe]|uniref:RNA helicase n=1 Tax=Gossypium australe TaxID=47621 RepID=A0A5B6WJK8_9ROSI|nr:DEAD-box ATP-dependent RNA helicase 38-like protein [Gossypium australe]